MSEKHMGSTLDDFLKEEGIFFEESQAQAIKVVAWQLAEAMKKHRRASTSEDFRANRSQGSGWVILA